MQPLLPTPQWLPSVADTWQAVREMDHHRLARCTWECHESLGVISTRLKTILKGGIQRQSEGKKEKKRYEHPNESVILPAAHRTSSSASPKSVMTTSPASMPTIQPRAFIPEGNVATKLPLKMPLTPPRTPLELLQGLVYTKGEQ